MAGGAFFPSSNAGDEEYELDDGGRPTERHAVQWVGTPAVKGPRWAKTPLLTVGMLGIQCVWSIEMGYASPYLLDLGLSKSWMSLVFMAGPLSGLIVQPLIGIFADRSRSRMGRRRPFMLIGTAICVFAMMLLGWTREISGFLGAGIWMAIALAVLAIYLIDFSINAVMSTDRALVVDTLPPSQQEEGSAWAGRMFGFGSVAGFFCGNLDLPPVLPFLGKSQLQILSFITSSILLTAHIFTSWAVTERVLLRDDRPQSRGGLWTNLRAIWDNVFTLPPGIRTVCFIQFFSSLGWFPVLFFTSVWVSEIYKNAPPIPYAEGQEALLNSDSVRAGARALFYQSLVNIVAAIGLPFLVSESGIQPPQHGQGYEALNGGDLDPPNSAAWKRTAEQRASGSAIQGLQRWFGDFWANKGSTNHFRVFTLIQIWTTSHFIFAACMAATWFVSTVSGAYIVIATTGCVWAVVQWAPYSLLGELILIDGQIDRSGSVPKIVHPRISVDRHSADIARTSLSYPPTTPYEATSSSTHNTPLHSRHASRTSLSLPLRSQDGRSETRSSEDEKHRPVDHGLKRSVSSGSTDGFTPLVKQSSQLGLGNEGDTSLVLHHSDEDDDNSVIDDIDGLPITPSSPSRPASAKGGKETADKAGVILGIHNVFLVLPQFVVTVLSSVIFYLMEPERQLPDHHPQSIPVYNGTLATGNGADGDILRRVLDGRAELGGGTGKSPDAVGVIFRIGGVSAAIGGVITYRMMKSWRRGEGL